MNVEVPVIDVMWYMLHVLGNRRDQILCNDGFVNINFVFAHEFNVRFSLGLMKTHAYYILL